MMARRKSTVLLLEAAVDVLTDYHPMTVRQVYYQLVARQVIENTVGRYKAVSNLLVSARKDGTIPWGWIEDRLRRPRSVSMWESLSDFGEVVVKAYRLNVWSDQPGYCEVWLEKDALSGIVEDATRPYGVTVNVGRGYDGWDSIRNAAARFGGGDKVTVLYFGDLDPSGEDMIRSLGERLAFFECYPEIVKCALVLDDIDRYGLPSDFAKKTDSRRNAFVSKYGDISVELDALPADVLRERVISAVEERMDLNALAGVRDYEREDRKQLAKALGIA